MMTALRRSVTTQPDPFADPTILAFPANPLLAGTQMGIGPFGDLLHRELENP